MQEGLWKASHDTSLEVINILVHCLLNGFFMNLKTGVNLFYAGMLISG